MTVILNLLIALVLLTVGVVFVTWLVHETQTYLRLRDERDAKVRSGDDDRSTPG